MRLRGTTLAALVGAVVLSAIWLTIASQPGVDPAATPQTDLSGLSVEELQAEKLRMEIEVLRRDTDEADSALGRVLSNGPLLTAIVGLIGGLGAWWKHLQQRADEAERAVARQLTQAVADLGDESQSIRASAAVTLGGLFRERSESLRTDTLQVVIANLTVKHSDDVAALLVGAFEKGIRSLRPRAMHMRSWPVRVSDRAGRRLRARLRRAKLMRRKEKLPAAIDLKDARLPRVNLSGLDLRNVSIKFADLHGADLTDCDLRGVMGIEVFLDKARLSRSNLHNARLHSATAREAHFHDCRMASIKLREADLVGADFCGAAAQSAQFEGADLRRAKFQQADLKNAAFRGSTLDAAARRSITDARAWRQARFSADDLEALHDISRRRRQTGDAAAQR